MSDFKEAGKATAPAEAKKFRMVRSIFGHGATVDEAKQKYNYIPQGGMNKVIEDWHAKQPERDISGATPSQITQCPRSVWLKAHDVPTINTMTWAVKQRLLLGRLFENQFAEELDAAGMLLHHWRDDPGVEVERFADGTADDSSNITGVPDYLLQIDGKVLISDAKTSRSDSFGYVPISDFELWTDWGYYKYRIQLTSYYMLCHSEAGQKWFKEHNLPLPEGCHLFVYALDDGLVRREVTWIPTERDFERVRAYTKRFNSAATADECPACTCAETFDQFEQKFCIYGVKAEGEKVASSCCGDNLIPKKG